MYGSKLNVIGVAVMQLLSRATSRQLVNKIQLKMGPRVFNVFVCLFCSLVNFSIPTKIDN